MRKDRNAFLVFVKKVRQSLLPVLMIALLFAVGDGDSLTVKVQAETVEQYTVSDHWLEPARISVSEEESGLPRLGAVFPEQFDARQQGWITSVKNQGKNETCWAFSTIAVIEANLIKNGRANQDIDLSENQLAYFFYNRQTDPLGYTSGDYNRANTLHGDYLSNGGTLQGTGLALATWAGVTTEEKSPYISTPADVLCYDADYLVKNVYMYDYDVTTSSKRNRTVSVIKQAVMDHGAVAIGIHMYASQEEAQKMWNSPKSAFYCTEGKSNHAVTIVGWDDTYSRYNFSTKPSVDGAWIVKNSYGQEFGDDGYMYVSYQDHSLIEPISIEAVAKSEQYDNNYQHDGTANAFYFYNQGEWYANVFTAKGAGGNNEELKAVGVYTLSENVNYEVQVYSGLSSAGKPTSGTKVFSSTVKGYLPNAGYQTIELPKSVSLVAGERFAVMIRLKDSNGKNANIGVDLTPDVMTELNTSMLFDSNWIKFIAKTGKNQSYVRMNGKWIDAGKEGMNIRIKAYTDVTSSKTKFRLNSTNKEISKGTSTKLSLQTGESNVYRTVTWKSSNSKVVSVNKNGKVKGISYGSATITASFVDTSKNKTLKCKVTVGPEAMKGYKVTGGKKLKIKWNKNSKAKGYEIYYATSKDGTYNKLTTVTKNSKISYNKKLAAGTYYVKMRPYMLMNKKKLYGSFTSVKTATIE